MSWRARRSLRPQPKMLAKETRCCALAAQRSNLDPWEGKIARCNARDDMFMIGDSPSEERRRERVTFSERRTGMCKRRLYLVSILLGLGSVAQAATIHWTAGGTDRLWSNPNNWEGKKVPTNVDETYIDVPSAAAPNGPVIQEGIDAKALGLACGGAGDT